MGRTASKVSVERQAFALREFKALDDNAGLFQGYVAVFGNLDGNGDIIDRGAFTKTLKEANEVKKNTSSQYIFPLLWQHKEDEPIGGFTDAHEDDHGLFVKGQFDLDIEEGRRAYSGCKKGYLRGLSIGYRPVKTMWDQKHFRHLLEIQLFEGSPVTFPANTEAQITSIKSETHTDADLDWSALETKKVSGSTSWPLAPRDRSWDAGAAHGRLLDWAGGKDDFSASKFASVHFWSPDGDAAQNVSDYKFPFCDIIDGSPKAVFKAISAGAGRLGSAQGVDKAGIQSKLATYYHKAAKEYNDDSIKPPWESGKAAVLRNELKQMGGLQAIVRCATCLDYNADDSGDMLEMLANACGMSMEDGSSIPGKASAPVAALLAGIDGLEAAIKAVIMAYQEYSDQTDALLMTLGIPDDDNDENNVEAYGPAYMSGLRSAFAELKAGRPFSAANHTKIMGAMDGIMGHVEEVKALMKANKPLDENDQDINIDQRIAAGKGGKPGNSTTSSQATSEPDQTTLEEFEAMLFLHMLENQQ